MNDRVKSDIHSIISGKRKFAFLLGDCCELLELFPENSMDCVITSPPYWKMREYDVRDKNKLIGNEKRPEEYVKRLVHVFHKIKDILKPEGSAWLNIGDKYHNKNLMGMPWRVAFGMQSDGWILRNDIIWDQMKGTQSVKDRLRDVYEHLFHFVKNKTYYYDHDNIRIKPRKKAVVTDKKVITATGVSGVKYRNQIINSAELNELEKEDALKALDEVLGEVKKGELVDFRMTIRGTQRTYHSNSSKFSGRAKELADKGYYLLKSRAKGYLPSDIWRVVPEDKWRKDVHYAVFPEELLEIPIRATCPEDGIVLDPFCGTGSAVSASMNLRRRGIGMDLSETYLNLAKERLQKQAMQRVLF